MSLRVSFLLRFNSILARKDLDYWKRLLRGLRTSLQLSHTTPLCLLLFTSVQSWSATVYVGTKGNDVTGNGTSSSPFGSFAKANQSARNGDSILFENGFYPARLITQKRLTLSTAGGRVRLGEVGNYDPPRAFAQCVPEKMICLDHIGKPLTPSGPIAPQAFGSMSGGAIATSLSSPGSSAGPGPEPGSGNDEVLLVGGAIDPDDPQGKSLSLRWTTAAAAGDVRLESPISNECVARVNRDGNYEFDLEVSDGTYTSHARCKVHFTATLEPCIINPQPKFSVSVASVSPGEPGDTIFLNGAAFRGNDILPPGEVSVSWEKVIDHGSRFSSTTILNPQVTFPIAGNYKFRLRARETSGLKRSAVSPDVEVRIEDMPVHCRDLGISLSGVPTVVIPTGASEACTKLTAKATWQATPVSVGATYLWQRVPSGKSGGDPQNPTASETQVCFRDTGEYEYSCTVTYNGCSIRSPKTLKISVSRPSECPVVSVVAGSDQHLWIEGPGPFLGGREEGCAELRGTVTAPIGVSYTKHWEGPSGVEFTTPAELATKVCVTRPGRYDLRLIATVRAGCSYTNKLTIVADYGPKHYIRFRELSQGACCDSSYEIKNDHPTCPIWVKVKLSKCIGISRDPDPLQMIVPPSSTRTFCTGSLLPTLLGAEFRCANTLQAYSEELRVPGIVLPDLGDASVPQKPMGFWFKVESGKPYVVERSFDLIQWEPFTEGTADADWVHVEDVETSDRRFYRVIAPE